MERVVIDLIDVRDKEGLHFLLRKALNLPSYYGENLDALWDCLMEITEPVCLDVLNFEAMAAFLDPYASKFRITLEQAAEENPCLSVEFH